MYMILNKRLNPCGILSLEGKGCPFYDDLRTVQIADDIGKLWNDTLTISVPYGYPETEMMDEGYHLLKKFGDGRYYLFRMVPTDTLAGQVHVKNVTAFNRAIWDLDHTIVIPGTLSNISSDDAFDYALQRSGWEIANSNYTGGVKDTITFNLGDTAMTVIQSLLQTFNCEMRAYVEVSGSHIIRKCIDIVDRIGDDTGQRLEYRHNLLNIQRQMSDDNLFTMLHVYGGTVTGSDTPISIAPANGGKDYLVDEEANNLYNEGDSKYLEGWVQNQNIQNPAGLLSWGKNQLSLFNHPKYQYDVSVSSLDWNPNIGDELLITDFEMQPSLTVKARVIQLQESESNPQSCQMTVGEIIEVPNVTPADIQRLQGIASAAAQAAQDAHGYVLKEFAPDGTDFSNDAELKRIIVRVYSGTSEVTSQFDTGQFVWEKINPDGSHDAAWETEHVGLGNAILVDSSVIGCLIRCHLDDDSIGSIPAYFQDGMTQVVNSLASIQRPDTLSIIFVTDTHYATGGYSDITLMSRSNQHMRNAVYLTHQVPIDLTIHGGDLTDGNEPKNQELDDFQEAASSLWYNNNSPVVFVNGNHDDASLYDQSHGNNDMENVLMPGDRYSILKNMISSDFCMNTGFENRLYGYQDFLTQKIRVICLNDFERPYMLDSNGKNKYWSHGVSGILQDQLSWLANVALKLPGAGWSVLIFIHNPLDGIFGGWSIINGDCLMGILQAYQNGSAYHASSNATDQTVDVQADFTTQGPQEIIAIISGHIHYTSSGKLPSLNDTLCIQTADCLARNDFPGQMPDRPFPKFDEDTWDIFTVDRLNRKIYATRFGAGADREFSY